MPQQAVVTRKASKRGISQRVEDAKRARVVEDPIVIIPKTKRVPMLQYVVDNALWRRRFPTPQIAAARPNAVEPMEVDAPRTVRLSSGKIVPVLQNLAINRLWRARKC